MSLALSSPIDDFFGVGNIGSVDMIESNSDQEQALTNAGVEQDERDLRAGILRLKKRKDRNHKTGSTE